MFLRFTFFLITLISTKSNILLEKIPNEDIAIIQYDSRPLGRYWKTSAEWNNYYAKLHNHGYFYYTSEDDCHYQNEPLASPWCKVRTMVEADKYLSSNYQVFIYMDSDAVINHKYKDIPLSKLFGMMQTKLDWIVEDKPMVFNQDGHCWWCNLIQRVGYTMCLNAGTVMWVRHPKSTQVLNEWWDSAMDSYDTNPIQRKFRLKWPWEQDRQMAVYNRSSHLIQIASEPTRSYLSANPDWCLSHLPHTDCYIQHFCENPASKKRMMSLYSLSNIAPEYATLTSEQLEKYQIQVVQLKFQPAICKHCSSMMDVYK